MRKSLLTVILGIVALASGCGRGGETIWSVAAPSPDGIWIATGRADRHSGPGNAAIVAGVYLQRIHDSGGAEPVLSFFNDLPPEKGGISLTIDWLKPSNLKVTFSRHPDLYLQVRWHRHFRAGPLSRLFAMDSYQDDPFRERPKSGTGRVRGNVVAHGEASTGPQ